MRALIESGSTSSAFTRSGSVKEKKPKKISVSADIIFPADTCNVNINICLR